MPNLRDIGLEAIEKIEEYSKARLPADQVQLFIDFIRLYFAQMPMADLVTRPIADLYGSALSQFELMHHRKFGELKIKIFNPQYEQDGWQSTHTIIQVIADDMPFMVDSMRMEINRLNFTTHLMVFSGGVKVRRNSKCEMTNIYSYHTQQDKGCLIEAPIQMEIDRQTDPRVLAEIKRNLTRVLNDVRLAVEDWRPMCARMEKCISELNPEYMSQPASEVKEAKLFLQWLLNDHFTFLGFRDYDCVGEGKDQALRLIPNSGLGVLRDDTNSKMLRQYFDLPRKAREVALSTEELLIISKTNTMSTVHRPTYTDYVGVKRFNEKGELVGERRFIGLYTSEAYRVDPREIPFIRHKVNLIVKLSKLPMHSHAGKDLLHIISLLPRDDLFHATTEELFQIAIGILHMQDRRCTRLFVRRDAYGRFISCILYLPRENLNTKQVERVQALLKETFHGLDITHNTNVSESSLARIHFVVRVNPRRRLVYDVDALESKVSELTQSWQDGLYEEVLDYFGEERGNQYFCEYRHAFPAGYQDTFEHRVAVFDIEHIEQLEKEDQLGMSFYRPLGATKDVIRFKLYHRHTTVPLSDAVPTLENMGLRVIGEQPYRLKFLDGSTVWINDFSMTYTKEPTFEVDRVKSVFQEAFQKIWQGEAENDAFNRLVLEAELTWREISVLRAYTKYFRQMGFTFSEQYIASTLINNNEIAKLLVEYFIVRFTPFSDKKEKLSEEKTLEKIDLALDDIIILDEDRIFRRYLALIQATLRTNYFQLDNGVHKSYLSLKLDPTLVPELPLPLPKYEIFVYSPRFEGVHLRAAKVARGGIRWSDRPEDFRTEVLGLMKAQQVKNALIVPAGAKGGFVPKFLPLDGTRKEILQEGIACYEDFISGLLDVTDNLIDGKVITHENTVCYDDEDPYIVVAADKGTATFSDIANRIAEERNYWLGDAFASGGSTGYDHKKMAITARGAWVSAERHFQNFGVNVDDSEITVVGIGDMSGDVFGNGMLLSTHVKLVGAFNHMHIFLDPSPDPSISFKERKRLFEMPRSTWDDYDKALISKGGGVYSRFSKAVPLTPEVKKLLNIDVDRLEPNDLIKAILTARVDLFWNGGIGTYVKASSESNEAAGDRSNDGVRVNGKDLNARVVCEGGNLGFTQLGRVEYELAGGRMNTDFIDNSAGVDTSDHEVNIKILLNTIVGCGDLTCKQRNTLLAGMSDEVADLVLQDNYQQNRVISLSSFYSAKMLTLLMLYIRELEKQGRINRELEFLPQDKAILERRSLGKGLTRPELAVLLAYTKNTLIQDVTDSDLVTDPYLSNMVLDAFPTPLRKKYNDAIRNHYLAKDIIATQVSNRVVSDMGITFIYLMQDEMGATIASIVRAYSAAKVIFELDTFNLEIESLDYQVDADLQYKMIYEGIRVVRRATRWFLRNRRDNLGIVKNIEEFTANVGIIYERLPKLMLGANKERFDKHVASLVKQNVPEIIAIKTASAARVYHALNIIEAASVHNADIFRVAKIYFMLVDRLDLLWFRDQINAYPVGNHWSVLAKAAYKGDLDWVQRALTVGVLRVKARSIPGKVKLWFSRHEDGITRWKSIISELRSSETPEFAILFVAIRELLDLAEMSMRDNYSDVPQALTQKGKDDAEPRSGDTDGM